MQVLKGQTLADLLAASAGSASRPSASSAWTPVILDQSRAEIPIETGPQTRAVRDQCYSPGGAGSVAANCVDLGAAAVHALGVVGADLCDVEMRKALEARGTRAEGHAVQLSN